MLEPHVVTLTSPREADGHDFFADRARGMCLFAVGRHDDDESHRCGAAAAALVDKIVSDCGEGCGPDRLRASILAARAQLLSGHIELPECDDPEASVAAVLVHGERMVIVQAGGLVQVYRVRDGGVEVLRTGAEGATGLLVHEEPLVDGDIFVLTCRAVDYRDPIPPAVEALAQESDDFGRALVACMRQLEERAALVVARWTQKD